MGNYTYNANDDDLSRWNRNFTSRIGDGSGDPEEDFLELVKLIVRCKPAPRVVDIGCGLGRFVDLLGRHVGQMICLEPDVARHRHCHHYHHDGRRVEVLNMTSGAYRSAMPDDAFDVVILAMVLQHVSTTTCSELLTDMAALLGSHGIGVLATTHQELERYTYQADTTNRTVAEFDEYCSSSEDQKFGVPVRHFSKESFLGAVSRSGLEILRWGQFCYLRPEKVAWYANWIGSTPEAIADVAISQYAIVQRSAGT